MSDMSKIKDYFELNPKKNTNNYTDYINYIDISSVTKGILQDISYLSDNFPSRANRCVKYDDILYSSVRPNLRHYYHYKLNYENVIASTGYILLRNKNKKLYSSKFLYYFLTTDSVVKYLSNIAELSQSTFPSFSAKDLGRIELPEFDFIDQKKIADILSAYDNLIENNNKRIKILEQIAKNVYKEWFVRFRFPGYEDEHFIEDIPSSWSYVSLGDIASFDRGISYSSDEINCDDGINLINLKNIQSYGGFRRDSTKQYNGKYKDSQIVAAGDLILGVTDMTQDRRTVGSVALIPQISGTSVISADLVKVNLKVPNVFFYCMCRYGFYSKYFSQFANGANVLHLKPNVLLNKKILLPTAELIEVFTEKVQPMIDIMDNLNRQNDLLIKQRDMLLLRLMSRKLEV